MTNPSGIHPTEFKVLVKPVEVEEKTAGGIIIPDVLKDKEQHAQQEGVIVAVSPFAFNYERWPEGAVPPQVGDKVLFARYAGFEREGKDGKSYRVINDKDVTAILD